MLIADLRRHSFVVRYLTLFGGEAFSKVCVLAAYAYLARTLEPSSFGVIELALSITIFFMLGAESGLGSYGARVVAETPDQAAVLIPRVGLIRATLGSVAYLVIVCVSLWFGLPGAGILTIYGATVMLTPFFTQWVFQGLRQMQWVAAGTGLRAFVFVALIFALVRPGVDIRLVAWAELSGAVALAVLNTVLLVRQLKVRLKWEGLVGGAVKLFRSTWYLGASDLAWAAQWYAPTLALGTLALGEMEEVAWLGSAVRIVMALHTFVWLYFFNLVPNLAKELQEGLDGWRRLIHRSMSFSMWAACFVALVGVLFAPVITRGIYGAAYQSAALPLQIVVWVIPVVWLSGHFRFSLIVSGHQHLEFLASAIAGITAAVLAYAGARSYGATGAATALLAGSIVNAVVAGIAMYRVIGGIRLSLAAPPVVTCAISLAVGAVVSWIAGGPFGAVVACLLYVAVTATRWDLTLLRLAWQGRLT